MFHSYLLSWQMFEGGIGKDQKTLVQYRKIPAFQSSLQTVGRRLWCKILLPGKETKLLSKLI